MGKKKFLIVSVIEAVFCVIWQLAGLSGSIGMTALSAFPFEQIGDGLRALSLSGTVGNVIAIILYILFCGLPFLALLIIHKKRKVYLEDGLLAMLSTLMFFAMYFMINPGIMGSALGGYFGAVGVGKLSLGVVLYSVLVGYVVLRALRRAFSADMNRLQNDFKVILYILGVYFVWAAFGISFGDLQASLRELAAGNTMNSVDAFSGTFGVGVTGSLGLSRVFLVIRYVVDILPYLLDVVIILTGLELVDALKEDRYSEKVVLLAQKLAKWCGVTLAVAILSNLAFNLLQLIFADKLLVIDGVVQLPILSILFVLIVLLVARLLSENKALKDDNDLFV